MVHVIFDVNKVHFGTFFSQHGAGASFFAGLPYQRGYGMQLQHGKGLGNVLGGLWKFLMPALRNLGIDVGKEALATGGRVMSTLATGGDNSVGETMRDNLKLGARNVLAKQTGRYPQTGGGGKRRRLEGRAFSVRQIPAPSPPQLPPSVPAKKRRRKGDVFDESIKGEGML